MNKVNLNVQHHFRGFIEDRGYQVLDVAKEIGCTEESVIEWLKEDPSYLHYTRIQHHISTWMNDRISALNSVQTDVIPIDPIFKEELLIQSLVSQPISHQSGRKLRQRPQMRPMDGTSCSHAFTTQVCRLEHANVPIRLDIDLHGRRYRDSITWNYYEHLMSPDAFASRTVVDLKLGSGFQEAIAESIRRQLCAYNRSVKKKRRNAREQYSKVQVLCIDVRVNQWMFHDQIEWDIHNGWNCPETFAAGLCRDMGLPGFFQSLIATAIREQVIHYRVLEANPDLPVSSSFNSAQDTNSEKQDGFLSADPSSSVRDSLHLENILRTPEERDKWQPIFSELTAQELNYLEDLFQQKIRSTTRGPTTPYPAKLHQPYHPSSNPNHHHHHHATEVTTKGPRFINAFNSFCQTHRSEVGLGKLKAVEVTKILGEIWRGYSDAQKDNYAQLAQVENARRSLEFDHERRTKDIELWEEMEARAKGLVSRMELDATPERIRALFVEEYMRQRQVANHPAQA